jgi:hypothetical protein
MTQKRKSKYDVKINTNVEAAVGDSLSEFESLGEEMREWYDNMPENLQSGSKGDEVSEAVDALENINTSIDVPEVVKELPVVYEERQGKTSRSARCGYATTLLGVAISQVEAWIEANEGHADMDDVEAFRDEAQNALDEAEGVSFPGMY